MPIGFGLKAPVSEAPGTEVLIGIAGLEMLAFGLCLYSNKRCSSMDFPPISGSAQRCMTLIVLESSRTAVGLYLTAVLVPKAFIPVLMFEKELFENSPPAG